VQAKYRIVRVWAFGDVHEVPPASTPDPNRVWYQLHNATGAYINYGPSGLQRLDYVVSTAERLGLKLVLPFINYWDDYGGMAAYSKAYGAKPDFYRNERSQKVYRDYIRILVTRYRTSPAIFSWQLCNEPRCPTANEGCDIAAMVGWASGISAYIKALDPDHMVSLGDEGWFGPDSGYTDHGDRLWYAYVAADAIDFVAILNISTLDYGTFHLYPSAWGYDFDWGDQWIDQHADAGRRFNKPVVLEEYGSPYRGNHTGVLAPWQRTILNSTRAADQVWQFGPANLSVNATAFGDDFSIYYDHAEFRELGPKHAQEMMAKHVG